MSKKLRWFYRISIGLVLILISANILVKVIIWPSSLKQAKDDHRYLIRIRKHIGSTRYTTEHKQKLFNKVDYLLAPAFITLFAVIAVKLVKTPEIFKEKD